MRRGAVCIRMAVIAWFTTTACACATAGLEGPGARVDEVHVGDASFILQYGAEDTDVAGQIKTVLRAVTPLLTRWGAFAAPVTIRIHPSHAALEAAIAHWNFPWLRAWARFDSIDLQSPRTWTNLSDPLGRIAELLTHELTHCLMYQRIATERTWEDKSVPIWFREGMASVTSHQEYRRPDDEAIWRYLSGSPGEDPVRNAEGLYQSQPEIVYGAAHDAFAFLERRYGDKTINAILNAMSSGDDFARAFEKSVGIDPEKFSREYIRYVRWEGWRGGINPRIPAPLFERP